MADAVANANGNCPEFDRAYWAHQSPQANTLRKFDIVEPEEYAKCEQRAQSLAQQGFAIDKAIMVDHQNPYKEMKARKEQGYTWVPSLLQPNVPAAPGVHPPGGGSYDPSVAPKGSIKVSIDYLDYPVFSGAA